MNYSQWIDVNIATFNKLSLVNIVAQISAWITYKAGYEGYLVTGAASPATVDFYKVSDVEGDDTYVVPVEQAEAEFARVTISMPVAKVDGESGVA